MKPKRKERKYKVRLLKVKNPFNPFIPEDRPYMAQFKTWICTIKAPNKQQIREWFREAQRRNIPSVRGKRIISIEEIKE
jgi:hypothetical protein